MWQNVGIFSNNTTWLPGPMAQHEPDINHRIWQVVALIPSGKVATYGDVARQAGMPGAARRVGMALRKLPAGTRIPWHRVINAQGRISLPGGSKAQSRQIKRLEAEGIEFHQGKIASFRKVRWNPMELGDEVHWRSV